MLYYNWQDNLKADINEFMKSSSQAMDYMIRPSDEQNVIKYLHEECPEVSFYYHKSIFSVKYNAILIHIVKKELEQ